MSDALAVLLIEDDPGDARLLQIMLKTNKSARFQVQIASRLSLGLEQLRASGVDVVLLDLMMPGMSGFEVLSRLKANPATRHIPVIIVTAKKLEEEERALLAEDALAILPKEARSREEAIAQIREALIAARR